MLKQVVFWFFVYFYFCYGQLIKDCRNKNEDSEIDVYIIISPIRTNQVIREIGIYWKYINIENGDVVKLFKEDPNQPGYQVLFQFKPAELRGFQKTGVSAESIPTTNLTFKEQCLKYYVSWIRDNATKKTTCLSTHPNWMYQRRNLFGSSTMRNIFIPGTHDSAAYSKFMNIQANFLLDKFLITQDEDILAQLIYGVRYLDIRVGRYRKSIFSNTPSFWANHGRIRLVSLQRVIDDVKIFLDNTNEIVIFDVHEFPVGFNSLADHLEFIDYLEHQFGQYYIERPINMWRATLEEIWSTGRRLIIGYNDFDALLDRSSIWPPVKQRWGDVRTLNELYKHLKKIQNQNSGDTDLLIPLDQPRAAMAELTPATSDIITYLIGKTRILGIGLPLISNIFIDRLEGLREMAENVNINVTEWYNEEWQYTANIVAVDFIQGTGIIETAIKWNDKRISGCFSL